VGFDGQTIPDDILTTLDGFLVPALTTFGEYSSENIAAETRPVRKVELLLRLLQL